MADPQFKLGTPLLLDVRQSKVNPTAEEVRFRAGWMAGLSALGLARQCAVVIGPRVTQYGGGKDGPIVFGITGRGTEDFS